MWLLASVLAIGLLSLACMALPGRARPLFVLPLLFGLLVAVICGAVRRSLRLKEHPFELVFIAAAAVCGYGLVVNAAYRDFKWSNSSADDEVRAELAIRMLEGVQDSEMASRMREDLENRRPQWRRFLERRYSALGPPSALLAVLMGLEVGVLLVGVLVGRRVLRSARLDHSPSPRSEQS
jgi:hypothetical protein